MEENQAASSTESQIMSFGNTPQRSAVQQHIGTPLQSIRENETPERESEAKTPVTINPFEVKPDSLYFPSCSPSIFATFARKTDNGQFRWSIDHVSFLYPADIDETSVPEVWVDPDHEKEAQKAIDAFFSQNSIVPSPWSSESKDKREIRVRRTSRKSSIFTHTTDVGVQTMLSIPPSIDLLALLGEQFLYNEENETSYSSPTSSSNGSFRDLDVMSTSSLRRKLFAADDGCETPSRLDRKDLYLVKQWSTPTTNMRSIHSTPSDLLSSSPITPPLCSETCMIRSSPQMSPIAGPSSQKSIRMRSFTERLDEESNSHLTSIRMRSFTERLDEESNSHLTSKPSSQFNNMTSENSMSFCMDSQDTGTFQSYASEKQDTGYVTGSMFSLQNVTSSDTTTSGFQSHITPVTGLFDDCGFNNATSNTSCTSENMSLDDENKFKEVDSVLLKSEKWSLVPNNCSTPTFNL